MKLFIARGYTKGLDMSYDTTDGVLATDLCDELVENLNLLLFANKNDAYKHGIELDSFPSSFTDAEKVMWINNVSDAGDSALEIFISVDSNIPKGVSIV